MNAPSEDHQGERPPDENAERSEMHLECIGSFRAHTQDGESRTIEIWTHFGAVHDRRVERVQPTLLVLTTTDGYGVDRVAQGQYRLTDHPEVSLSSDDPNAP
jgi:hypothetical protein